MPPRKIEAPSTAKPAGLVPRGAKRGVLEQTRFRLVLDCVACRDVRDLMGHHARELGLVVSGEEQSLVHVEEPTRQRKRINFIGIDYFDRERHLRIGVQHDVLADAVDVLGDQRVFNKLGLTIDFRGRFASLTYFLFRSAGNLTDEAAVDVALANHRRVFIS